MRVVLALLMWMSAASLLSPANAQSDFYTATPAEIAGGRPGTLIRTEILNGTPDGASAYRMLYRSVGLDGQPIAVSGVAIVPPGPGPAGGRPVVAWAHPTTGVQPQCGPSRSGGIFQSIQGLRSMLARGYIVTATDYPGLGAAGVHPYLVGSSAARSVVDSVRAAGQLPSAAAGRRFTVWGHSQGGHAALFTGILAKRLAPELDLVGVAAAAPATELATLLSDDIDTDGGRNLTAMTLWSWTRVYKAPLNKIVSSEAIPVVDQLAADCLESLTDIFSRLRPTKALERRFLVDNAFAEQQPWRSLLSRNTPGLLPRSVPVYIAQGTSDTLVRPQVTRDYADKLCRAGSAVQFDALSGVGHLLAARDSADAAIAWMDQRFKGVTPPSVCAPSQ
ncbi:alpha/beta fold hydrolase [Bosea sp. BIWAKO-01]|uniref:alpha/beta fold hydrolase n=1 Tax=Bosea sp. BIWAKO-01 TaxID=506668 RepID=UPI000852C719|nr:alpha/beta fold hydrolase [Bosea sp. BIWAKO-01]GAU83984.1 lysophospholipase [Bosea sp. BIWAKO-01]